MADVAFHAEFSPDGLFLPSGPGDTLRLIHALRGHSAKARILTVGGAQMLKGFINTQIDEIGRPEISANPGATISEVLSQFIEPHVAPGDRLIHTFIGEETEYPWAEIAMQVGGKEITRRRVDSSRPTESWMFHSRWANSGDKREDSRILAVPIRSNNSPSFLDTPDWFSDLVHNVAQSGGWKILWLGGSDRPPRGGIMGNGNEYLPYQDKTLLDQIQEVRGRAAAAVGWNSGGLDIASVAGLPTLRIGEFQKYGNPDASGGNQRRWGQSYNSYLAVGTNIGLAPSNIEAEKFPKYDLERSIETFLSIVEHLHIPRHVILEPGEVLCLSNYKDLLTQREVQWPI